MEGARGEECLLRLENSQLKVLVADMSLKNIVLKYILIGTAEDPDY